MSMPKISKQNITWIVGTILTLAQIYNLIKQNENSNKIDKNFKSSTDYTAYVHSYTKAPPAPEKTWEH